MKNITLTLALMLLASCSTGSTQKHNKNSDQLNVAISQYTNSTKHLDAYLADYFNVEEDLGKFGDFASRDYFNQSKKIYADGLASVKDIDATKLSDEDQLTLRLFREDMETNLKTFDFPNEYLEFNQMGNRLHDFMDSSSQALSTFPFDSVKHYHDYLSRMQGLPAYVDRQIALLKEGVSKNVVLSCTVAGKVPNSYHDGLEKNVEKNPFYRPIEFIPKEFSAQDRKELTAAFKDAIHKTILPSYKKFDDYYRHSYMKSCRQGFGLVTLPDGAAWYRAQIKENTNLDLSPRDLHQTGLKEVERITAELEKVKEQEGYQGSLHSFLVKKVADPKSFFTSSKDMFDAFEKVKAETAKRVPNYFSLIPEADFKIVSTSNPEDASGSYNQPTETAPYGRFMINTHNLRSVPRYDVTTLSLHETVPGHHFQLALQYEMKDQLSEYQRKIYNSNAFVEGWALYAEYLGNEMGMFKDPDQRFGNLNDEMLRAVRLVVDTGIHDLGWSQKQAVKYAQEHLASDIKDITVEINRYSVWPGQALGYKVGQMKILELRHKAEQMLGNKFDIKGFHKAVIGNGTVSLGILESQVNDWIKKQSVADAKH